MTKQVFEDQIIEIVDSNTLVESSIGREGTIRVNVKVDRETVRSEAGKLYDQIATTETPEHPEASDPAQPFTVTASPVASVQHPKQGIINIKVDGRPNNGFYLLDIEAWQDDKQAAQVFANHRIPTGTKSHSHAVRLPAMNPGTYDIKVLLFDPPAYEGEPWGKKLWGNEDAGTFTVTAAPAYESTAPVMAGYARLSQQVDQYVGQYPELKAIADQPTGVWLGMEWVPDAEKRGWEIAKVSGYLPPLIVVYSIPNRDTGEYSQGGAKSPEAYKTWIDALAKGIGDHPAIYILEPDALGHVDRMSDEQQMVRRELLVYAATTLASNGSGKVYIDASTWVQPEEMAKRIKRVQSPHKPFAGFSINTSNYKKLPVCREYGDALSKLTGLPYLIDTSRNGIGTDLGDGRWCNVPGQALGERPDLAKGYVWAKAPGESDGPENGGPAAGQFWVEGALALVRNGR